MIIESKYNINVYTFIYAIVCIILGILLEILSYIENDELLLMRSISFFTFVEWVLFLLTNFLVTKTKGTFSSVFISLVYVFHFGQVILFSIDPSLFQYSGGASYLHYFSAEDNYYSFRFINYAFVSMCTGCLLFESVPISREKAKQRRLPKIATGKIWILLLLTLPVKVLADFTLLKLELAIGHSLATQQFARVFPPVLAGYGLMAVMGMGLLLLAMKDYPRKQAITFFLIITYFFIIMIGGSRGTPVSCICLFVFLYLKSTKSKIDFKKTIVYLFCGYLFLLYIYAIVIVRNASFSFSNLSSAFSMMDNQINVICKFLASSGNTGYTAECVLVYWLRDFSPSHGYSYLGGVVAYLLRPLGILPNDYYHDAAFGRVLQDYQALNSKYFNIGGSAIGEAFFNFGEIGGVLFCLVIGGIVGFISNKCEKGLFRHLDYKSGYIILLMVELIFYVRGYFPVMAFRGILGYIFLQIILRLNYMNLRVRAKNLTAMTAPRRFTMK